MTKVSRFNLYAGLSMALPLCALFAAGARIRTARQGRLLGIDQRFDGWVRRTGGGPGGPGGPGGMRGPGGPGGGGRGGPVAENASGAEILSAKCGCHGAARRGPRPETYGPFRPLGRGTNQDHPRWQTAEDAGVRIAALATHRSRRWWPT